MEAEAGSGVWADILRLGLTGLLVLMNGFFVSAEFALVSVRRTRIEELVAQGNRTAEQVRKAIHDPDRFIAATQLGITIASLGLGWIGEPALSHLIDPLISWIPIPSQWVNLTSHSISAALAFVVITFLHVVVGELAPKSIALQKPEATAMVVATPTIWTETIFKPAIWALNGAGNLILRLLGFEPAAGHEMVHSAEELKLLVEASAGHGMLEAEEYNMLDAVLDLRDLLVRQVMVPRTEMAVLSIDATLRDVLKELRERPYVKFPIYEEDADHIAGVLYVRDIVEKLAEGNLDAPVRPHMRDVIYVPETSRMGPLLAKFRQKRQHIAIALDEYGGTAGLVTLEDVLEEIAGDVPDQYEQAEPELVKQPDGSWTVSGLMQIGDFNEILDLSLADENYDTLGGYVMGRLERIPKVGDEISTGEVTLRVEQMDEMRVARLRATKKP